jgi:RNA polymerase sigma factor (sigma-70 family)
MNQLASADDVEGELFSQIDHVELSAALATLPDRQRAILSYRYRDHLTLEQVGELIGVSYSRICQIEQATLRDLRGLLEVAEVA